eukprot:gnl/MRDRNA2_/MRDRNA2_95329_c0_seq1.p1 gnl/MRDRNA2_/MRDRNA2_95329_c0~~gnl/MRDRNA2_/MRDRNA2_95329_c0_seq1.p1  ORF type:complete len:151 (+),score=44.97 gnl/MRDRNA2_/MRDRNA2_95329_c0_seq1:80-532(+)
MSNKETVKALFLQWDKNSDGQIDKSELRHVFKELDADMSDPEIDAMFDAADKDSSGTIDINEFVEWIYGGGAGTEEALIEADFVGGFEAASANPSALPSACPSALPSARGPPKPEAPAEEVPEELEVEPDLQKTFNFNQSGTAPEWGEEV